MAKTRVYRVSVNDGDAYLVRAYSQSSAMAHVAKHMLKVEVATQDNLIEMLQAGSIVESASPQETFEDQRQLPLEGENI